MNEKLFEQGKYYLIADEDRKLHEVKVERLAKNYVYLKFITRDQDGVHYKYEWMRIHDFEGYGHSWSVYEELDPTWYRKEKLERIVGDKETK